MKKRFLLFMAVFCLANTQIQHANCIAQETRRGDDWFIDRDTDRNIDIYSMDLMLHAKEEAQPALKYQFIGDDFTLLPQNANIYYLRALGFLEQDVARTKLREISEAANKKAQETNVSITSLPPQSWYSTPPKELPIDEVKQFLAWSSFQAPELAEAAKRRFYLTDRDVKQHPNPGDILLPDVQKMRELADFQRLRFRVALVEDRIDDAFQILGQQYSMARHLGEDEFSVSNLLGAAIADSAWEDGLYLCQSEKSPNLYWAYASLPSPLIDGNKAMGLDRRFLLEHVKLLKEVDENPRPIGYWQDFIERIVPSLNSFAFPFPGPRDPQSLKRQLIAYITAAYPSAREYLCETCKLEPSKVDALPTAQVVFLAIVRFNERDADEGAKWSLLPIDTVIRNKHYQDWQQARPETFRKAGWVSIPSKVLSFGIFSSESRNRVQQHIAVMQTIEAIKLYGASNQGKLPQTLDETPLPCPNDPFTGKPFFYEVSNGEALLKARATSWAEYRLRIRMKPTN